MKLSLLSLLAAMSFGALVGAHTLGGQTITTTESSTLVTVPSGPQTMLFVPKDSLLEIDRYDKMIIKVGTDGSVEYGKDVKPEEAAKEFWKVLASVRLADCKDKP